MTEQEVLEFFVAALNSREAADRGEYCSCVVPIHTHTEGARPVRGEIGLMCEACGFRDKGLEVEMTRFMNSPHAFEPDGRHPYMCRVCSNWEDNDRHKS